MHISQLICSFYFILPSPRIFFTLETVSPSPLCCFGDGWSSPELERSSLLHGFEVVDFLSELFEDDDPELENSESENKSEAENPLFIAALSRDSKSFLEGFEMRLIVTATANTIFGCVILRNFC
jgi:hypothetical protein